jgi:hypothetical protein
MTETVTRVTSNRVFRKILTVAISLALLPAALAAWLFLLHDNSNIPLCNKQTFFEVMNWFDNRHKVDLPNVRGQSAESLVELKRADDREGDIKEEAEEWNEKYQYVPGLCRGDPGDLVLMYMKKPTRWLHHATSPPSIFREAKWCVVSLDFGDSWPGWSVRVKRTMPEQSECAENLSSAEFISRLRKTLDFLREHDRPNWQTVVAENEKLLKSIDTE